MGYNGLKEPDRWVLKNTWKSSRLKNIWVISLKLTNWVSALKTNISNTFILLKLKIELLSYMIWGKVPSGYFNFKFAIKKNRFISHLKKQPIIKYQRIHVVFTKRKAILKHSLLAWVLCFVNLKKSGFRNRQIIFLDVYRVHTLLHFSTKGPVHRFSINHILIVFCPIHNICKMMSFVFFPEIDNF